MITMFSFWSMLIWSMYIATYIPDLGLNGTALKIMRPTCIVLALVCYTIANHFEDKLKERVKKLEGKINKEDS